MDRVRLPCASRWIATGIAGQRGRTRSESDWPRPRRSGDFDASVRLIRHDQTVGPLAALTKSQPIVLQPSSPGLTGWLAAVGSLLAALATISLVIFAWRQIKEMREQLRVTREAEARQWYPLVYAHQGEPPGPDPDVDASEQIGCYYYLRNEGLGPALNIAHGIEVWGRTWAFGGAQERQFRSVQPTASIPPALPGEETPDEFIVKHIPAAEFYVDDEVPEEVVYWCRYESLFGDRWETRNSSDPGQPPEIKRLDPSP